MGVRSECDPGCSRPCYAAWWPGVCSGWGRERIEVAARAFLRPRRASGATAYHPHPHVMAARQAAVGNMQAGFAEKQLGRLADCIDRGLDQVQAEQETIREYVEDIEKVAATLEPGGESCEHRQERFEELIDRFERNEDPIRQHMATLMTGFLAGLFVGAGKFEEISDFSTIAGNYRDLVWWSVFIVSAR